MDVPFPSDLDQRPTLNGNHTPSPTTPKLKKFVNLLVITIARPSTARKNLSSSMKSRQTSKKASFEKADRGSGIEDELVEEDGLHDEEDTNDEEDDEDDDDDGSLTDESEDEWAEERKAVRYIAESELEDNDLDLSSDDQSDDMVIAPKSQSIGSLVQARKNKLVSATTTKRDNEEEGTSSSTNRNRHQITKKTTSGQEGISESEEAAKKAYSSRKPIAHRSHKHAPIEISSKKAVTRKRTIVEVPKIERRDPRFDSLSGAVNEVLHQKSFGFLKEQRRLEIEELRQTLNKAKKKGQQPLESLELLQEQLRREENKEVQNEKIEREKLALRKWKAQEREQRKEGKGAFYLKKKAQKEVVLTDRYEHLSQNKSKLNKSIERKRKKVDGKDKKSMPNKRQPFQSFPINISILSLCFIKPHRTNYFPKDASLESSAFVIVDYLLI
ncbi:hypothetical protein MJO28_000255 [Puccinia striiformis f. sp. tritici]|uniref:Uncharacterized protein n=1 Tax=Puccinia striiformis f. sp. tritici TaxID=168172 RepID=A0ACC0EY13_9BASI|nr:hypothetical protein MJO28_000255 [Puccinia striiformis f. sp. tritici]